MEGDGAPEKIKHFLNASQKFLVTGGALSKGIVSMFIGPSGSADVIEVGFAQLAIGVAAALCGGCVRCAPGYSYTGLHAESAESQVGMGACEWPVVRWI